MDRMTFIRVVDDNPNRFRKYHLSPEDALALWDHLDGKCGYCGLELGVDFHVDHNHRTGATRSLLHPNCNTQWVGPHDVESARLLVEYLESEPWVEPEREGLAWMR